LVKYVGSYCETTASGFPLAKDKSGKPRISRINVDRRVAEAQKL
jgi:hypothetical protein